MPTNAQTVLASVHKQKTREKDHHQIMAGNTITFSFYLKRRKRLWYLPQMVNLGCLRIKLCNEAAASKAKRDTFFFFYFPVG